jgi:hypothetical protein
MPRFCSNYDIWVCRFYDCFEALSLFPQALEPEYYLYEIERRARPKDPHGGVLIAAKKELQLGNFTKSKDIELIT